MLTGVAAEWEDVASPGRSEETVLVCRAGEEKPAAEAIARAISLAMTLPDCWLQSADLQDGTELEHLLDGEPQLRSLAGVYDCGTPNQALEDALARTMQLVDARQDCWDEWLEAGASTIISPRSNDSARGCDDAGRPLLTPMSMVTLRAPGLGCSAGSSPFHPPTPESIRKLQETPLKGSTRSAAQASPRRAFFDSSAQQRFFMTPVSMVTVVANECGETSLAMTPSPERSSGNCEHQRSFITPMSMVTVFATERTPGSSSTDIAPAVLAYDGLTPRDDVEGDAGRDCEQEDECRDSGVHDDEDDMSAQLLPKTVSPKRMSANSIAVSVRVDGCRRSPVCSEVVRPL